jgi:hypothetical protein
MRHYIKLTRLTFSFPSNLIEFFNSREEALLKNNDNEREFLLRKAEYHSVISMIHQMEVEQADDKTLLKTLSDPEERSIVRARIMKRRRGPHGLASFSKTIYQFYRKYPSERRLRRLRF